MTSLQDMDVLSLTHGSLFSGIGGFDLAAEWAGWQNMFNCEIDEWSRNILKYYWPNAKQYSNIRATDFTVWRGRIDVLTGGFPCQPFSLAGKRLGTEDERHLWPEMLRAIREIRPEWVVGENVFGIINWSGGLVFEQVCTDLENEGYEVQPFIIPACGVDAPHRRDRVWFVAHRCFKSIDARRPEPTGQLRACWPTNGSDAQDPLSVRCKSIFAEEESNEWQQRLAGAGNNGQISADYGETGIDPDGSNTGVKNVQEWQNGVSQPPYVANPTSDGYKTRHQIRTPNVGTVGYEFDGFPTQSPICGRDDGFSNQLDRDAVFAGRTQTKRKTTTARHREDAIRAYGNAVVPQIPWRIFDTINQYERLYR